MPSYDSLLQVTNDSENSTYLFSFNSQRVSIPPGQTRLVPFDAVINRLGDPRSGPIRSRIQPEEGGIPIDVPSRYEEICRLAIIYGLYTDNVNAPSHIDSAERQTLLDVIPRVTVSNPADDSPEPIIFPCDDPFCDRFSPDTTDQSQNAMLQRQLDAMRKKMIVMEQVLKQHPANPITGQTGEQVAEDTPDLPATQQTINRGTARRTG